LTVRLVRDGDRVAAVAVGSTRPFAAPRVFVGRTGAAAAAMVPQLFSVCAQAQGVAAAAAVEAAGGGTAAPPTLAARTHVAVVETIQEYLWRMLIDWPQALGLAPDVEAVAAVRRRIAPALAALAPVARRGDGRMETDDDDPLAALAPALVDLATRHVFGVTPAAWLALPPADALAAWAARAPTTVARLLHELLVGSPTLARSSVALMAVPDRAALRAGVVPGLRADPAFERAPQWDGAPAETGALARMHAHPFVAAIHARCGNAVPARLAARLVELAVLVDDLASGALDDRAATWSDAFALGPGEGLAAVQTARGLLLHHVVVADGRVAGYRIVAPTEWNFHPRGALVAGLATLAANDEARLVRDARLAVQALDPCVGCRVEVVHA